MHSVAEQAQQAARLPAAETARAVDVQAYQLAKICHDERHEAYRPLRVPEQPATITTTAEQMGELLSASRNGCRLEDYQLREVRAYSHWLSSVTWAETTNAGRLGALLRGLRDLWALLERHPGNEELERMRRDIERVCHDDYRMLTLPRTQLEAREAAPVVTRDYAAMPREWREL